MDAFISRKRRRVSPPPNTTEEISNLSIPDDDDSTDFKLAMLSSLHPDYDQQTLLDVLLAHDGSIDAASASLRPQAPISPPPKAASTAGYQSSLASYATSSDSSKKPKLLSKKGKTLHLYDPEDVAAHTPCSIIHNFLPAKEANDLLEELLLEAPTFEKMTFKLFDNVVSSPHTACFYVENLEEQRKQKTEYLYNGATLTVSPFPIFTSCAKTVSHLNKKDVRQLTPQMRKVSPKIAEAVNTAITERIRTHYPGGKKLKYQSPNPWRPNAAFVNCYAGAAESVGYHSDQLTFLGPRAIIGSLSLGVAREFRVRRIVPQEDDSSASTSVAGAPNQAEGSSKKRPKRQEDADLSGQISIHLPHNSLLVMHAEMQEEWKHSIAPAQTIEPHPISGIKRINITYRDYKANMHPRYTPSCRCGVQTVLRVVQRKKENWGRYFWMCHAGNVPGKEGCTFFAWAEFDEDGDPIWDKGEKGLESKKGGKLPSD